MSFKIGNTEISIDYYFVAILTLMLVVFKKNSISMCFISCLMHEAGHLIAIKLCGARTRRLSLGYFGMKIDYNSGIISNRSEIFIAFAGPVVNLIFAVIFGLFNFDEAMRINLGLALFNILPVEMLDGGRILCNLLSMRTMRTIGISTGAVMSFVGAIVAIYTKSNFTILIVSLYVLIGSIRQS